jgi:hypothetical protein
MAVATKGLVAHYNRREVQKFVAGRKHGCRFCGLKYLTSLYSKVLSDNRCHLLGH